MEALFKFQVVTIESLILDNNPLVSLDLLEKFLIEKAHLRSLSLRKCELSSDAIRSLFIGAEANIHLERLDISFNKISGDSCHLIAESFRKSKLKFLSLMQC